MKHIKKNAKSLFAKLMVLALVLAYIPVPAADVEAASNKVNTKMYTISKKAGTYSSATKITIKAKKGYKVYYTTGSKLFTKKLIKSNKKKTLTIKKTTTVKIYAVKKSTKITAKKLKSKAVKKKIKSYKYTINTKSTNTDTTEDTTNTDTTNTDTTNTDTTNTANTDASNTDTTNTDSSKTDTGNSGNDNGGTSDTSAVKSDVTITDDEKKTSFTAKASSQVETDESNGITTETITDDSGVTTTTVTVSEAGTFTLGGYVQNLHVNVNAIESDDNVVLNLNGLVVDNRGETSDSSVINIEDDNVVISLNGTSKIIGASDFVTEPAAIISASDQTVTLTGEEGAELNISDAMAVDKEYVNSANEKVDPADGITAGKGKLVFESGIYNIYTNGDCVKGTGKKGNGGVTVNGGTLNLVSYLGNGIKSKNGVITISGGTVNSNYTYEDAINAKNYSANITGGTVNIDNCYGDGIQGENVNISDGTVNIKTYYEYAGKNFYDTALGSGNYNTLTKSNNSKTETVNVDTGSHKGIKAGTKAKAYSYTSVAEGSAYTAGETYSQVASGGLIISGGTINIDTTKTGIKYNGSAGGTAPGSGNEGPGGSQPGSGGFGGGGTPPSGSPGGNGNPGQGGNSGNSGSTTDSNGQVAAVSDGGDVQYIIGCPEDGIHSNNTTSITGGTITIKAADDGIASTERLDVTGASTVINIETAYEGIESGTITVGTQNADDGPSISVYTNDDGINAAKKSIKYVYADEDEEKYTKTSVSAEDNSMAVYSGKVTVEIGDDQTHSVTLPNKGSSDTSITYSSDGDGIDCNGSFYAYGGTVIVYGASSGSNSPIDIDDNKVVSEGAVVLEIGSQAMDEGTKTYNQPYVTYSSAGVTSDKTLGITNSSGVDYLKNALGTITTKKSASYVLFSSPDLASGTSYTLTADGSSLVSANAAQ